MLPGGRQLGSVHPHRAPSLTTNLAHRPPCKSPPRCPPLQRYKICPTHCVMPGIVKDGRVLRFCQQVGGLGWLGGQVVASVLHLSAVPFTWGLEVAGGCR